MFELFGCFRDHRKDQSNAPIDALVGQTSVEASVKYAETGGEYTILDTKQISDGLNSTLDEFSGNSPPEIEIKPRRRENWRVFIEKYGIDDYIERLANELHRAWEYRKYALKAKYPYAKFYTLNGEVF